MYAFTYGIKPIIHQSEPNYIDCLAFFVNFSNCQFGFHVLKYYLAVKVHLNIRLPLTVKKNYVETYIY